jgi:hypothetical protein
MSREYSIKSGAGSSAIAATYKSIISAIGSANARVLTYDLLFGTIGTPADQVMQFSVDNETGMVAGTNNTTVTPTPNSGNPATTEPTVGSNFMEAGFNMRQLVRWTAKDGKELVTPAVAQAGIGLRILSPTYAGDVRATLWYKEG